MSFVSLKSHGYSSRTVSREGSVFRIFLAEGLGICGQAEDGSECNLAYRVHHFASMFSFFLVCFPLINLMAERPVFILTDY